MRILVLDLEVFVRIFLINVKNSCENVSLRHVRFLSNLEDFYENFLLCETVTVYFFALYFVGYGRIYRL